MSENTPTVVLVHGAFADGASWSGVIERLQATRVPVMAPANPLRGIASDSGYLASVLAQDRRAGRRSGALVWRRRDHKRGDCTPGTGGNLSGLAVTARETRSPRGSLAHREFGGHGWGGPHPLAHTPSTSTGHWAQSLSLCPNPTESPRLRPNSGCARATRRGREPSNHAGYRGRASPPSRLAARRLGVRAPSAPLGRC